MANRQTFCINNETPEGQDRRLTMVLSSNFSEISNSTKVSPNTIKRQLMTDSDSFNESSGDSLDSSKSESVCEEVKQLQGMTQEQIAQLLESVENLKMNENKSDLNIGGPQDEDSGSETSEDLKCKEEDNKITKQGNLDGLVKKGKVKKETKSKNIPETGLNESDEDKVQKAKKGKNVKPNITKDVNVKPIPKSKAAKNKSTEKEHTKQTKGKRNVTQEKEENYIIENKPDLEMERKPEVSSDKSKGKGAKTDAQNKLEGKSKQPTTKKKDNILNEKQTKVNKKNTIDVKATEESDIASSEEKPAKPKKNAKANKDLESNSELIAENKENVAIKNDKKANDVQKRVGKKGKQEPSNIEDLPNTVNEEAPKKRVNNSKAIKTEKPNNSSEKIDPKSKSNESKQKKSDESKKKKSDETKESTVVPSKVLKANNNKGKEKKTVETVQLEEEVVSKRVTRSRKVQ